MKDLKVSMEIIQPQFKGENHVLETYIYTKDLTYNHRIVEVISKEKAEEMSKKFEI